MAWTTPRTWTTGELVTAAIMNTHVRDNLNVLNPGGWTFILDGFGAALTTGSKVFIEMPFATCLQTVTMITDGGSTLEIGLMKATAQASWQNGVSALYGSSPLKAASTNYATIATLTTWSPSLAQGQWVGACVRGASGTTWAAIGVRFNRS